MVNKSEGIVSVKWKPVAKVSANSSDSTAISWNEAIVAKFSIDKAAVEAKFYEESQTGGPVSWS